MDLKKLFEDDFNKLSQMDIREYTFYRCWEQIHNKSFTQEEKNKIWEVKQNIWKPKNPEDYLNIQPIIIPTTTKSQSLTWNILRIFASSTHWNRNPGRSMRFLIMNKDDKTYLGVISLGSDFISLKPRDDYIKWDRKERLEKYLKYTAIGSSIIPSQPLGYNYAGGKLISLLVCSKPVVDAWNKNYNKEKLIGITTTSLFGGFSQYTRLNYWRKCGTSVGKIMLEPSDGVYHEARDIIKKQYPKEISKIDGSSHPKTKMLSFIYSKAGIRPPYNNAPRGVYWCRLYTKTNEFLRGESKEFGEPLFDNSMEALTELWKEKFAKKRLKNIIKNDKYDTRVLFYDDLMKLSWEETKEKYLKDVGR